MNKALQQQIIPRRAAKAAEFSGRKGSLRADFYVTTDFNVFNGFNERQRFYVFNELRVLTPIG